MKFLSALLLSLSAVAAADKAHGWGDNFKNLVAFGDSYTDEGRLNYFSSHNGSAPPPGYIQPPGEHTASGGRSWARYVVQYTPRPLSLYNYAVSGAVCSNDLTPRYNPGIFGNFPSVQDYELPAFKTDVPLLDIDLSRTVASLWIGTNDIGGDAFLSDAQLGDATLVDYVDCVLDVLKKLRKMGIRHFVLQNLAPLEYAPLYTDLEHGGATGPNRFWLSRGDNATEHMVRVRGSVAVVNEILKYRVPAAVKEQGLKGAKVALFDSYGLMSEVYHNPQRYLNGSLPLNVTGYNDHCDENWQNCFKYRPEDRDSFFWYDELHPSEQVHRVIAKEFSKTLKGKSKYATYW